MISEIILIRIKERTRTVYKIGPGIHLSLGICYWACSVLLSSARVSGLSRLSSWVVESFGKETIVTKVSASVDVISWSGVYNLE